MKLVPLPHTMHWRALWGWRRLHGILKGWGGAQSIAELAGKAGLKAKNSIAQGNALGIARREFAPCKGSSKVFLPLQTFKMRMLLLQNCHGNVPGPRPVRPVPHSPGQSRHEVAASPWGTLWGTLPPCRGSYIDTGQRPGSAAVGHR